MSSFLGYLPDDSVGPAADFFYDVETFGDMWFYFLVVSHIYYQLWQWSNSHSILFIMLLWNHDPDISLEPEESRCRAGRLPRILPLVPRTRSHWRWVSRLLGWLRSSLWSACRRILRLGTCRSAILPTASSRSSGRGWPLRLGLGLWALFAILSLFFSHHLTFMCLRPPKLREYQHLGWFWPFRTLPWWSRTWWVRRTR